MAPSTVKSYTTDQSPIFQGPGIIDAIWVMYTGTTDADKAILKSNGTEIWRWEYDDTDETTPSVGFQFGSHGAGVDTPSLDVTATGGIYVTIVYRK